MDYFWVSFRKEKTYALLGCIVISGCSDLESAVSRSKEIGKYPGGIATGRLVSERSFRDQPMEPDVLYTKSEISELGYDVQ